MVMGWAAWKISWTLMRWMPCWRAQVSMERAAAWGSGVPGGVAGVEAGGGEVGQDDEVGVAGVAGGGGGEHAAQPGGGGEGAAEPDGVDEGGDGGLGGPGGGG